MAKYILSVLLTALALSGNAQAYLNPGVDTSNIDVQKALRFYNAYIQDFNGGKMPNFSKYWSADELKRFKIPDQQVFAINQSPLYAQSYKTTILYAKPLEKCIHLKTQFSAVNDGAGNIMTLAITNHYVDLSNKNAPYFINPFTKNLLAWKQKQVRNVKFFYQPQHKFNMQKADSLIHQIIALEKLWGLQPIDIRYYMADSWDELQRIRGFDFALTMGNPNKPQGISDDIDDLVFCAGLGENYFHEVVHVYLNRRYPKSPLREGLAVFLGGSAGRELNWQLKRVNDYLEQHPQTDLNDFEDFWYSDLYTNPESVIKGMICHIVYAKDGMEGLKRLMSYTSLKEIFKVELQVENDQWNSYLRTKIREYSKLKISRFTL